MDWKLAGKQEKNIIKKVSYVVIKQSFMNSLAKELTVATHIM